MNNPTQIEKYGNLSARKMIEKFSKCDPAREILLFSGFHLSENKKRLIWNTADGNLIKMKYIYNMLDSMMNPGSMNTRNSIQQSQPFSNEMQQNAIQSVAGTQNDTTHLLINLMNAKFSV